MTKSIKKQEKELKRIMQSQKSLANATKGIVKLMKIHDAASTFSLIDVNQNTQAKGSANFINTRLISNDPKNFSRSDTNNQFRINSGTGATKKNQDLTGKGNFNSVTK